ncbi:L-rhamnose-binding lectin CSL3-like [Lytechinus variegatus]|uniref:L-rhamnose-binding lectin CSL3-like n=1 Tax=Lytechinus variegatus TaxID=7654 RepID=UPI001BB230BD|nr:L-rhamnose-binding lectin CSL3-like [Lytechinus variegatus]XP_041463534.1 L-rhamnose-binding lectin CSL3-like [Lytechinus variegatus]XP_041463535.1 L-rhamnose-binding lectin CSL3-like [Lytechinus variegatus]
MATMARKLILCCFFLSASFGASRAIVERECEGGTLSLECPNGFLISINYANYGRTAGKDICPHRYIRTTRCFARKSLKIVKENCDGRPSCSVAANNDVFGEPCFGTFKYLEVDYSCHRNPGCNREQGCEGQDINLQCPEETPAIHICNAMFGRQLPGSDLCPHPNIRTTNCASPISLNRVRSRCEGRSSCSVAASSNVFGEPCYGTYKYLEIDYVCARRGRMCEGGTLTLSCSSGQIILVMDVFYGRKAGQEVCPNFHVFNQNCQAENSVGKVEAACNGKSSCSVDASNSVFGDPCKGTHKYLDVLYECV